MQYSNRRRTETDCFRFEFVSLKKPAIKGSLVQRELGLLD